jgi:hypothetical protein
LPTTTTLLSNILDARRPFQDSSLEAGLNRVGI